jgi:hypothetical protein
VSQAAEPSAGAGETRKCTGRVASLIAGGEIVLEPQTIDDTR